MPKCAGVIVAAGKGSRMGTSVSKQFLKLSGKEILIHTLEKFENCEGITEIVLVTGKDDISFVKKLVSNYNITKLTKLVAGGNERQYSVWAGITAVDKSVELIAVHDGARPFVQNEDILKTIAAATKTGAAAIGVPLKDTLKLSDAFGKIAKTVDRSRFWTIQTPQIFQRDILTRAFEAAIAEDFLGTDECMLLERMGVPISLVLGHYDNIKITTKEDLYMGEAIFQNQYSNMEEKQ